MSKKYLSLCIAALLVFALALPALALVDTQPKYNTPAGYNDHDYQKLVAFLEQADEDGVKNGEKVAAFLGNEYDPEDPTTWSSLGFWKDEDETETGINWLNEEGEEHRLNEFDLGYYTDFELVGCLDLSGCESLGFLDCACNALTGLVITDCPHLWNVNCGFNEITELDLSSVRSLYALTCSYNSISELDFSACPSLGSLTANSNELTSLDFSCSPGLEVLSCADNGLTELDVSACSALRYIYCPGNALTELDLSASPCLSDLNCLGSPLTELDLSAADLPVDRIVSEGSGTVSFTNITSFYECGAYWSSGGNGWFAAAVPADGESFLGWFNAAGELIGSDFSVSSEETEETDLTARFTGNAAVPGDMNGDGEVDISDALYVLRAAMGLLSVDPHQLLACDIDGDGELTVADALQVMRAAMGLITLG